MVFVFPYLFCGPLTFLILVGGIGGQGGINMASASTPSANEPAKDIILVHTVQLKPMINYKWCSVRFSTLWENPSEEIDNDNNNYYYYEKSQEFPVFVGQQKWTSSA